MFKFEARDGKFWRLQYPNGEDDAAKAFIRSLANSRDDSDWQDDPEYVARWRFTHVTGGYHEPGGLTVETWNAAGKLRQYIKEFNCDKNSKPEVIWLPKQLFNETIWN